MSFEFTPGVLWALVAAAAALNLGFHVLVFLSALYQRRRRIRLRESMRGQHEQ